MVRNIVTGERVGEWVAARISGSFSADRSTAIGLAGDEQIIAGVIYENWNGRSIVCHIAIESRSLTPGFLAAIFDYPFNVCGATKIMAPVSATNAASQRLVVKMGFTPEARIADASSDGSDMIFYTMRRNDCRYLGARYGKKLALAAPAT